MSYPDFLTWAFVVFVGWKSGVEIGSPWYAWYVLLVPLTAAAMFVHKTLKVIWPALIAPFV